jgi:hypothetical protein
MMALLMEGRGKGEKMEPKKKFIGLILTMFLSFNFVPAAFAASQATSPRQLFTTYYVDGTIHTLRRNVALDVFDNRVNSTTLSTMLKLATYMKSQNSDILVGVIKTGHTKYVKGSNRISWHYYGKAFDVYNTKMASKILPWVYANRKALGVNELIYDARIMGKNANIYNLKHGKPYSYGESTLREHRDHIHISTN